MINFCLLVVKPLMNTFFDRVSVELLPDPTNKFSSSLVASSVCKNWCAVKTVLCDCQHWP